MSRQRNIAAAVVAVALCTVFCWSCGSGTVDEDAWARGLIVKIDGTAWTKNSTAGSPHIVAQERSRMAYDSACKKVVLFGGHEEMDDTWECA